MKIKTIEEDSYKITKTPIKKTKTVYVADDGSEWDTKIQAERREQYNILTAQLDAWPQTKLRNMWDEEDEEPDDTYYLVKTYEEAICLGDLVAKKYGDKYHPGTPNTYPALIHYRMEYSDYHRDSLTFSYVIRQDAEDILKLLGE